MKRGLTQAVISAGVFAAILLGLISVDPQVRDRVTDLVYGGNGVSPWGDRVGDLVGALAGALRTQSIDNAPMLVFCAVGAVLVVFMVRT